MSQNIAWILTPGEGGFGAAENGVPESPWSTSGSSRHVKRDVYVHLDIASMLIGYKIEPMECASCAKNSLNGL
jgi:hypothetical protein